MLGQVREDVGRDSETGRVGAETLPSSQVGEFILGDLHWQLRLLKHYLCVGRPSSIGRSYPKTGQVAMLPAAEQLAHRGQKGDHVGLEARLLIVRALCPMKRRQAGGRARLLLQQPAQDRVGRQLEHGGASQATV